MLKKDHHSKSKEQDMHRKQAITRMKRRNNRMKESPSKGKKMALKSLSNKHSTSEKPDISIMMTSHHEPHLAAAIQAIITQEIKAAYEIVIVSPDKEAEDLTHMYAQRGYPVHWIKDQGKGKAAAINDALKEMKGKIIVFTDGDVTLLPHAINEIIRPFENSKVGCVSGRVISANAKNTMLGYWSHLLADAGAHEIRKRESEKKFLECTGYLFACRNHVIKEIPVDVAEDTIIPYMFRKKEYDIAYAEHAQVLVKNPTTWDDWLKQRVRTAKAHETLKKYVDIKEIPRVKSFTNEMIEGFFLAWSYPHTIKEYGWTALLMVARLYMWIRVFYETRILRSQYNDKWTRIATAR